MSFAVKRTISSSPSLPYEEVASAILGKEYDHSLVICADTLARRMNREYRKKIYSPNVLSFPYSKKEGEIILNARKAEREARQLGIPVRGRVALLFVHGCFHLAGYDHSDKMEALEQKILQRFKLLK